MTTTKVIVVDSDAIFALYNPNDPLNNKATRTFERLVEKDFYLLYPTSVVFEIISLFQRVLTNTEITNQLANLFKTGHLPTYVIDNNVLRESITLFDPVGSKKNTLVDCSVVVVAKETGAIGVFSYDNFYKKQGLTLAEEL